MPSTALITGASTGIGRELATLFAADGHDVILVARSEAKLETLAEQLRSEHGIQAHVWASDLSMMGAAVSLAEEIADANLTVDFLVNNAGFGDHSAFQDIDPETLVEMIQLNIMTLTELARHYLPEMIGRGFGRILNVASMAGFQPGPNMAVYYATKAYVLSLSEALHEETSGTPISVTVLCPGPTHTEFQNRAQVADKRLFTPALVQEAPYVARIGYRAMMRGRAIAIPGMFNRMSIQLNRLMPRRIVRKVVKSLQPIK